jgi:hypothetical protein
MAKAEAKIVAIAAGLREFFPEEMRTDPDVIAVSEIVAFESKADLASIVVQAFQAEYPSKRKALSTPVETLRKDLSIALLGSFLGSDAKWPATNHGPIESARSVARAYADELRIKRIEAQGQAAITRKSSALRGTIPLASGGSMDAGEFVDRVTARARELVQDHERTHGRPATMFEAKAAVRAAKAEIIGAEDARAIIPLTQAAEKRARKRALRLEQARREGRELVGVRGSREPIANAG